MAAFTYQHAVILSGVSTLVAVLLSANLVRAHLLKYGRPALQKHVIRIVLMVPLFAIDSFIGVMDIEASETFVMVLDSIKECYEAVVIHSFLQLMYAYLGVGPNKPVPKTMEGRHIHHSFPVSLFSSGMHLTTDTVNRMHFWTSQFMVIRPLLSLVELGLEVTGNLETWHVPITIILNLSVSTAVYALVSFYHAFAKELAPFRPLAQFLCIKGVVFLAFWQGVILELAVWRGWLHAGHWYTVDELTCAVQNFLVCLEMGLIFAAANAYAFAAPTILTAKARTE